MRTTINIDEGLLLEAKKLAAATGQSLGRIVEDGIRERLARREGATRRAALPVSSKRGGPQPGVDLDDTAALLELMDQIERGAGEA